jgi:O-acetyl-ADP-ribose deacetylase (regulator of RNase III)
MPINVIQGDLLRVTDGIIVHGCNCQGVYGAGVAKQIAQVYPQAKATYLQCIQTQDRYRAPRRELLGMVDFIQVTPSLWIANAFTQEFYGREPGRVYSSLSAIQAAFEKVSDKLSTMSLGSPCQPTISFPCIGAGLGGGDWQSICQVIERVANRYPFLTYDNYYIEK